MTTQPPAFMQQQFQDALDEFNQHSWHNVPFMVREKMIAALQQCAEGCGELDEAIRLIAHTRNHQEKKYGCESCLDNLNTALELLRKHRTQKGD